MINICIFEDDQYSSLFPLTMIKPCYDLLCGMTSLYDKIERYFGYGNITLHCRDSLKPLVKNTHPEQVVNVINTGAPCLFINGRVIMTRALYSLFSSNVNQYDLLYTFNGHLVAAYLRGETLDYFKKELEGTPNSAHVLRHLRSKCVAKELDDVLLMEYPWDLMAINTSILETDFAYINTPGIIKGEVAPYAVIHNESNVFIGSFSTVEDFVVIDASKGPVYISEHVTVQSGSRLEGPLFISPYSQVLGARVSRSSLGYYCKVGGEVTDSVLLPFSNKAHSGFLGHSYVGEWVNLGAGSTTSNLKNTYSLVNVSHHRQKMDTQLQFLGSIIGDHVKLGIGSLLDTGTIIGFGSSLTGSAIHPKEVPAFTWGGNGKYDTYDVDRFVQTANRMMGRRHRELREEEVALIRQIHQPIKLQKAK